jgi:hypothetical protein
MSSNRYVTNQPGQLDWYGCHYLFIRPSLGKYVTQIEQGTAMVTGIYHSEDLGEFLQQSDIIRRIVDYELRRIKSVGGQVEYDHFIKQFVIRLTYLRFFKHLRHLPSTEDLAGKILQSIYGEDPLQAQFAPSFI